MHCPRAREHNPLSILSPGDGEQTAAKLCHGELIISTLCGWCCKKSAQRAEALYSPLIYCFTAALIKHHPCRSVKPQDYLLTEHNSILETNYRLVHLETNLQTACRLTKRGVGIILEQKINKICISRGYCRWSRVLEKREVKCVIVTCKVSSRVNQKLHTAPLYTQQSRMFQIVYVLTFSRHICACEHYCYI